MSTLIDYVYNTLIETGVAKSNQIRGCTDEQIEQIKQSQHAERLPLLYEQFLRKMGQFSNHYLGSMEFHYPALIGYRVEAQGILEDEGVPEILPHDAFIIYTHQGYEIYYFHLQDESGDPPVYAYDEETRSFVQKYQHLSALYLAELNYEVESMAKLGLIDTRANLHLTPHIEPQAYTNPPSKPRKSLARVFQILKSVFYRQ